MFHTPEAGVARAESKTLMLGRWMTDDGEVLQKKIRSRPHCIESRDAFNDGISDRENHTAAGQKSIHF